MYIFSLAEAKAQLSELIELVEGGERVTITKRGNRKKRPAPPACSKLG